MPREWLYVVLADRFHRPPWELRDVDAAELAYWTEMLAVEGAVSRDWSDGIDDNVYFDD